MSQPVPVMTRLEEVRAARLSLQRVGTVIGWSITTRGETDYIDIALRRNAQLGLMI